MSAKNSQVKRKSKFLNQIKTEDNNNNNKSSNFHKLEGELAWSSDDLKELLAKIEEYAPQDDTLLYSTRIKKLPWNSIAFKNYSATDCKQAWLKIQEHLRRFRILNELVSDARLWLTESKTTSSTHCTGKHSKCSLAYILYFVQHKNDALKGNPNLARNTIYKKISDMYKNLPPQDKEKYLKMAMEAETAVLEADFSNITVNNCSLENTPQRKKLKTPFELYYEDVLKNSTPNEVTNKKECKNKCKLRWKELPDEEKMNWINIAEKAFEKCKNQVEKQNGHGSSVVPKSVLSKTERLMKEKFDGKPVKPPNSAYHLFLRNMLQSDIVKNMSPQERMSHIASMWKATTSEERNQYKEEFKEMTGKYKEDYARYLLTLPAERQQEELKVDCRKRKSKYVSVKIESCDEIGTNLKSKADMGTKKQKFNNVSTITEEEKLLIKQKLISQKPKQPPLTAVAYFKEKYNGSESYKNAWMKLNRRDKRTYARELYERKKAYIVEYEKFLRSLSKEELLVYSM